MSPSSPSPSFLSSFSASRTRRPSIRSAGPGGPRLAAVAAATLALVATTATAAPPPPAPATAAAASVTPPRATLPGFDPAAPDLRPHYAFIDLGTLGGSTSRAAGVNRRREVIGTSTRNDRPACVGPESRVPCEVAFRWSEGRMVDLGHASPQGQRTVPTSLDERGRFVGFEEVLVPHEGGAWLVNKPFLHDGSGFHALPLLVPGTTASGLANAINARGVVTGFSDDAQGDQVLVTWDAAGVHASDAPHYNRRGQGLSKIGVIAGWQYRPRSFTATNGFVEHEGRSINLSAEDVNLWSEAMDVNDAGLVVGDKADAAFQAGLATEWRRAGDTLVATRLGALPGHNHAVLLKVNRRGVSVGYSEDMMVLQPSRAIAAIDGTLVDLTAALHLEGVQLLTANGINDLGDIVGEALRSDGQVHAYLLRRRD